MKKGLGMRFCAYSVIMEDLLCGSWVTGLKRDGRSRDVFPLVFFSFMEPLKKATPVRSLMRPESRESEKVFIQSFPTVFLARRVSFQVRHVPGC